MTRKNSGWREKTWMEKSWVVASGLALAAIAMGHAADRKFYWEERAPWWKAASLARSGNASSEAHGKSAIDLESDQLGPTSPGRSSHHARQGIKGRLP